MYTETLTQRLGILGKLDPVSQGAGTTQPITDVDIKNYRRLIFFLDVGAFGASGTVDFKLQESKTAGGAYQDIANKAITQLVASGGNNRMVTVEVRQDELDAGYEFVRYNLVVGTTASLVQVVFLRDE